MKKGIDRRGLTTKSKKAKPKIGGWTALGPGRWSNWPNWQIECRILRIQIEKEN